MMDWVRRFGMPTLASAEGVQIDRLMVLLHMLMAAIFIGWFAFCVYALIRFRKSKHPKADYHGAKSHASHYVEVLVFGAEVLLLAALSIPFWVQRVAAKPDLSKNPVQVQIVAQQYAWNIRYPGADGIFGRTKPELVDDQSNPLGIDPKDEHGKDDIVTLNQLHLPVNRPVVIWLTSKDVIHSLNIPDFRVKRDAIPGMRVSVEFTPTMTTAQLRKLKHDPNRNFEMACAQLCGLGHFRMRGYVTVHTQDGFKKWLKDHAPKAQSEDDIWN